MADITTYTGGFPAHDGEHVILKIVTEAEYTAAATTDPNFANTLYFVREN